MLIYELNDTLMNNYMTKQALIKINKRLMSPQRKGSARIFIIIQFSFSLWTLNFLLRLGVTIRAMSPNAELSHRLWHLLFDRDNKILCAFDSDRVDLVHVFLRVSFK